MTYVLVLGSPQELAGATSRDLGDPAAARRSRDRHRRAGAAARDPTVRQPAPLRPRSSRHRPRPPAQPGPRLLGTATGDLSRASGRSMNGTGNGASGSSSRAGRAALRAADRDRLQQLAPDLLVIALLIAAREMRAGDAAGSGSCWGSSTGRWSPSRSARARWCSPCSASWVRARASCSRGQLPLLALYLFAGKWVFDSLLFLVTGDAFRAGASYLLLSHPSPRSTRPPPGWWAHHHLSGARLNIRSRTAK
jgi:hypothetical protein